MCLLMHMIKKYCSLRNSGEIFNTVFGGWAYELKNIIFYTVYLQNS